jgi:predicted transcriptional regulator|tara:strand:+ start:216 stop:419 length:204 start_codon:yes stop_codon:yes gene_type:complete
MKNTKNMLLAFAELQKGNDLDIRSFLGDRIESEIMTPSIQGDISFSTFCEKLEDISKQAQEILSLTN